MRKRPDEIRKFTVGFRRSNNRILIDAKSQTEAISVFREKMGCDVSSATWALITARPIKGGELPSERQSETSEYSSTQEDH